MRFWIARDDEVPVREQIVTQIVLGILSDDLSPGQRLPSTRDLARRFRLHLNTISAAYRQLERERWVEFRHGSGVYIRKSKPAAPVTPALALDQLITNFFRSARELGLPLSAVHAHLRQRLASQPPDHFLLVEPDEELRQIIIAEMSQSVSFPIIGKGLEACRTPEEVAGAIAVALTNRVEMVRQALPAGTELLALHARSVPGSLGVWLPAPADALIGIASRWPRFLKLARTMLTAAGFPRDSLVFRDARLPGWQRGLKQTAAVVCDSITAARLPKGCRAITFSLVADSSLAELRRCQQFVSDPFAQL